MGLGKTFVGSEKMLQLNKRVNLVICQKSKVNDWVEHFVENYQNLSVYNLTDKLQFKWFIENQVIVDNANNSKRWFNTVWISCICKKCN